MDESSSSIATSGKVDYKPDILLHLLEASEHITKVPDLVKNLAEYTKEDESTFKTATVSAYKRRMQTYAKTAARYKHANRLHDLEEHWKSDFRSALWTEQEKQRIIECGERLPHDENDDDSTTGRRSIALPAQPSAKRARPFGVKSTTSPVDLGGEGEEQQPVDSSVMPLLRKLAEKFDKVLEKLQAAEQQIDKLQNKITALETNNIFTYGYIKGLEHRRN